MQSVIFQAKDFQSRQECEEYIRAKVGIGSNDNKSAGHSIQGTKEEMAKLNLDDQNSVFGIRVIITDKPTTDIVDKRIKNGKEK